MPAAPRDGKKSLNRASEFITRMFVYFALQKYIPLRSSNYSRTQNYSWRALLLVEHRNDKACAGEPSSRSVDPGAGLTGHSRRGERRQLPIWRQTTTKPTR